MFTIVASSTTVSCATLSSASTAQRLLGASDLPPATATLAAAIRRPCCSGEGRDGAACVREDVTDVGRPCECAAVVELSDRACRVQRVVDEIVGEAHCVGGSVGGGGGVHEDDRSSLLQLREQLAERGVAEIAAAGVAHQADAVELQHVEAVLELGERAVDVGKRKDREAAEPCWVFPAQFRGELVATATEASGLVVVSEVNPGRADRRDRRVDAEALHELDCALGAPRWRREPAGESPASLRPFEIHGPGDLVVGVDPQRHHQAAPAAGVGGFSPSQAYWTVWTPASSAAQQVA